VKEMKELIKNRKLNSHAYGGWRVKDALRHAVNCPDVRLVYEERYLSGPLMDENSFIKIPYLKAEDNHRGYKVRLTNDEAEYFLFLKNQKDAASDLKGQLDLF
jgi:hypothetical protein